MLSPLEPGLQNQDLELNRQAHGETKHTSLSPTWEVICPTFRHPPILTPAVDVIVNDLSKLNGRV